MSLRRPYSARRPFPHLRSRGHSLAPAALGYGEVLIGASDWRRRPDRRSMAGSSSDILGAGRIGIRVIPAAEGRFDEARIRVQSKARRTDAGTGGPTRGYGNLIKKVPSEHEQQRTEAGAHEARSRETEFERRRFTSRRSMHRLIEHAQSQRAGHKQEKSDQTYGDIASPGLTMNEHAALRERCARFILARIWIRASEPRVSIALA